MISMVRPTSADVRGHQFRADLMADPQVGSPERGGEPGEALQQDLQLRLGHRQLVPETALAQARAKELGPARVPAAPGGSATEPPDPAQEGRPLGVLGALRRLRPPLRRPDHARVDQLEAVEERGQLGPATDPERVVGAPVDPLRLDPFLVVPAVVAGLREDQVAAGGEGLAQGTQDLGGTVVVRF
jgi:hypothetical protein